MRISNYARRTSVAGRQQRQQISFDLLTKFREKDPGINVSQPPMSKPQGRRNRFGAVGDPMAISQAREKMKRSSGLGYWGAYDFVNKKVTK